MKILRANKPLVAVLLAVSDLVTASESACAELKIPLIVEESRSSGMPAVARSQDPVTLGIPLPDSARIRDTSQLGLTGTSTGQFRVLGRWPSGNIKWILVDTMADAPAGRQNTGITLTTGSGNFGGADLAADKGTAITVDTGTATFVLRKAKFNLIDQAVVNGKTLVAAGSSAGLVVVGPSPGETICPCSTLYTSANDENSTAVIEENGPVRTVIKATGQHIDSGGHAYMRYTVRLHFYKNKNFVKIVSSLQNADYGGSETFATAYKGFAAYEARVTPAMAGNRSFSFGNSHKPAHGDVPAHENVFLYQGYSNKMEDCGWVTPDTRARFAPRSYVARKLLKAQSCLSTWSYAQEGYKVFRGNEVIANGGRAQYPEGWADIEDSSGAGILAGVYQLTAYWPKSLEFRAGGTEVRIGIWPDQSLFGEGGQQYFQSWPQYSLHTLYLNFHNVKIPDPGIEFQKFQAPLIARTNVSSYNDSGAFFYPLLDPKEENNYYRSLGVRCCIEDYNAPRVYRTYAWPSGGGGNQEEMRWADLMLWLQRGFVGRYLDASNFYTFQTEQVFPRSDYSASKSFHWRDISDSPAALTVDGFPGNVHSLNDDIDCDPGEKACGRNWIDVQHAHWYGMIDYYFITGNEFTKDAIEDGVSDIYGNPNVGLVKNGTYWNSRDIGAALMSDSRLALFYGAVGNSAASDRAFATADTILAKQVWPELTLSAYGNAAQGVSRVRGAHFGCCAGGEPRFAKPFEQGILSEGLAEILKAHGDTWPGYYQTSDLAFGIASFALTEGWRTNRDAPHTVGCKNNTGPTYEIFLDKPNNPLLPSCSQTAWFTFYNMAQYLGSQGDWKAMFQQYLRHLNLNGGFYQESGLIFPSAIIGLAINRLDYRLVSVAVTATKTGNGSYSLSWVVPAGATKYRIKYSNKNIVEWLNFDPETNIFGIDPATHTPWFAASDVTTTPPPAAAGTTQTLSLNNVDSQQELHFAMKAYVRTVD
jgi:YetA-like protein